MHIPHGSHLADIAKALRHGIEATKSDAAGDFAVINGTNASLSPAPERSGIVRQPTGDWDDGVVFLNSLAM